MEPIIHLYLLSSNQSETITGAQKVILTKLAISPANEPMGSQVELIKHHQLRTCTLHGVQ